MRAVLLQTESASGRYLVSQRSLYSTALGSRVLSKRFPYFSIPAGVDSPTAELLDNTKVSIHCLNLSTQHLLIH